ncbi:unnamed protein product [Pedinophyceae sp. YPF-701]|nr:unnamed protein product [Pedinophyceae sp. YPF-701]
MPSALGAGPGAPACLHARLLARPHHGSAFQHGLAPRRRIPPEGTHRHAPGARAQGPDAPPARPSARSASRARGGAKRAYSPRGRRGGSSPRSNGAAERASRGNGRGVSGGRFEAERALNSDIVRARSMRDILAVLRATGDPKNMSPVNLATALHRLSKHATRAEPQAVAKMLDSCDVDRLLQGVSEAMSATAIGAPQRTRTAASDGLLEPRHVANVAYAVSNILLRLPASHVAAAAAGGDDAPSDDDDDAAGRALPKPVRRRPMQVPGKLMARGRGRNGGRAPEPSPPPPRPATEPPGSVPQTLVAPPAAVALVDVAEHVIDTANGMLDDADGAPCPFKDLELGQLMYALGRLSRAVTEAPPTPRGARVSRRACALVARLQAHIPHTIAPGTVGAGGATADVNCWALSNAAWALASCGVEASKPVRAALEAVLVDPDAKLGPLALANILWALARMSVPLPEDAFYGACARIEDSIEDMVSSEVSMTLWSLGSLTQRLAMTTAYTAPPAPPSRMLAACFERALALMPRMTDRELSNVAWSMGALRHRPPTHVLAALAEDCEARLATMAPRSVAAIAWALATVAYFPPVSLFTGVAEVLEGHASDLAPGELSALLWSLAVLAHLPPHAMDEGASAPSAAGRPGDVDPDTQGALAGSPDVESLVDILRLDGGAVPSRAPGGVAARTEGASAGRTWAYALWYDRDGRNLLTSVADELSRSLAAKDGPAGPEARQRQEDAGRRLWAVATARAAVLHLVGTMSERLATVRRGDLVGEDLRQLMQVQLLMNSQGYGGAELLLPDWVLQGAEERWKAAAGEARVSGFQAGVLAALQDLGYDPVLEMQSEGRLFSVDVALALPDGRRIAVEADGPSHFTSNTPLRPLGPTLLRRRLLRSLGWEVVSVPFVAWDINASHQERIHVLRDLLAQHGVAGPDAGRKTPLARPRRQERRRPVRQRAGGGAREEDAGPRA